MRLLFFLIFPIFVFSQNVHIGNYYSEHLKKSFNVSCEFTNREKVNFFIETHNNDEFLTKTSFLKIKQKELPYFTDALDTIISVFKKWKLKAEANNIQNIEKLIKTPYVKASSIFQYGNKYHLDLSIDLQAFFIAKKGNYYIKYKSRYRQQSWTNQFINAEPLYIIFSDNFEVELLKDLVNYDKALDALIHNESKNELFKQ